MEQNDLALKRFLTKIYEPGLSWKELQRETRRLPLSDTSMVQIPRGETFIRYSAPLERVCFLLDGRCSVVVASAAGTESIADIFEPVQCFGLLEALLGGDKYSASIKATATCTLLWLEVSQIMEYIRADIDVCHSVCRYLARLAVRNMDHVERRSLLKPYDTVAHFLYREAAGKPLPHVVSLHNNELAAQLHINLRTLYRHLDRLKAEGMLLPGRGRLTVGPEQYERLCAYCQDIL